MKNVAQAKQDGSASAAGRFLRIDDVIASTGLSRATIYRMMANSDFPRQHPLTKRCIGWWQSDVDTWLKARLAKPPAPP
jgi:prophage regulatory protein